MANEFKVKKGLIVAGATGGTALDVQGSQGQLFSVTDDLSGSIFAVSDISGVPILDVNSSGLSTFDGDVNLPDSKKILLGTGNDFQLYHDGTHGVLNNTTGNLYTSALGSIIFRTSLNVTALTLDTSQNATFAGTLTAPTFLGDLNGTINTATTGTTQTAGNNSTLIATTAYADAAAAAVPIGNYLPLAAGSGSPLTGNLYLEGAAQNIRINNGTQPVVFLGDGGANTDGQLILYSSTGGANVVFSGDTQNHYITNGNVGIGTTSPSTKLHIVQPGGSSQLTLERTGSSAGKAVLAGAAEGLIVYDGLYGAKMYVGTSGTYNGNVGIGTISPDAQLEISNSTITDGSGGATLRLTRADNTSVAGDPVGTIEFYSTDADGPKTTAYIKSMSEELYGRKGSLAFGTSITNNADAVEAMRINSSGNVGIGTTSPIVNLQVGDGTTDTESRFYHNDASYTSVRGYGIWMSRFASYFRPVTTNTQTLYVGHTSNVWNAISNNANTHVFSTGANERMRITSTGNVGIGTTSPGTKLTISGGDDAAAIGVLELITSGGTNLKFGGNNGYSWIQSHASKPLYINQLGNNVILNSGGGNVGIGTTSPQQKLHVAGNGRFESGATGLGGYVTVGNPQETAGNYSAYFFGNTIHDNIYMKGAIAYETLSATNGRGDMHFLQNSAANGTNASISDSVMTILNDGNVGIGTTTPLAKLDIQGTQGQLFSVTDDLSGDIFSVADISGVPIMTVNSNGTSYFDGNVGIGTDSPGSKLQVGDYMASNVLTIGGWYGGGGGTLAFKSGYVPNAAYVWDTARIKATDDGNFNGRIEFQTTASGGNAGGSPTTKMVLKANGNVGIGTTSPKGKLQINGNGNAWNDAPSVRLWDTTNSKGWLVGNVNNYTAGDFYIRTFATVNTDPTSTSQEFTIKHATGNVGIGTTSPGAKLHIHQTGSGTNNSIITEDDARKIFIGRDSIKATDLSDNAAMLYLQQNGGNATFGGSVYMPNYLYHSGDTDTFIGFPGSNQVSIKTSGNHNLFGDATATTIYGGGTAQIKTHGTASGGNFPTNSTLVRHNLLVGTEGGSFIGGTVNYATSQGWVEDAAPNTGEDGYYGGSFSSIGTADANSIDWDVDPFGSRSLVWTTINDAANDADGGWNKTIQNLPGSNKPYMSVIYVRRNGSETTNLGAFYHGCDGNHTLNLNDSANTNPYFTGLDVSNLPIDVWCVSIGFLQAYDDTQNGTNMPTIRGVYRLDTGAKITDTTVLKMKQNSTQQSQRVYHFYSTNTAANLSFSHPGFYTVDGNEPTLGSILGNSSGLYLPLAGGTMTGTNGVIFPDNFNLKIGTGSDLQIYHSGTESKINNDVGNLSITNFANDSDIIFSSDNGSGATTPYLVLDGSTTHAYFSNPGNVGIGTTNPGSKLEISSASDALLELNGGATGNPYMMWSQAGVRRSYIQHVDFEDNLALASEYGGMRFLTGTGGTETERMRILANGNVGIGTISPSDTLEVDGGITITSLTPAKLLLNNTKNGTWTAGEALGLIDFYGNDASGGGAKIQSSIEVLAHDQYGAHFNMTFNLSNGSSGNTERMRLTGEGRLGIGTTNPESNIDIVGATNASSSSLLRLRSTTALNTPEKVLGFYYGSTPTNERGYISLNQYSVTYSTSSDYRLKENIVPIPNGIERLKELKPCRFNFIQGDPNYVVDGFIAHEAQEVVPEAVTGEKDAVDEDNNPAYQGIDQSKIVPLLTAALQEAISKIEQLETRIQTLENN